MNCVPIGIPLRLIRGIDINRRLELSSTTPRLGDMKLLRHQILSHSYDNIWLKSVKYISLLF